MNDLAALRWAADEARAQANLLLHHAREAARRARKYDQMAEDAKK